MKTTRAPLHLNKLREMAERSEPGSDVRELLWEINTHIKRTFFPYKKGMSPAICQTHALVVLLSPSIDELSTPSFAD